MNMQTRLEKQLAERKATRGRLGGGEVQRAARAALREYLSGQELILRIEVALIELYEGGRYEDVLLDTGTASQVWVPHTRERIAALRAFIDGNARLLNKVMPDIQSREFSGPDGRGLFERESREELEANLRRLGIDPIQVQAANALR